MRDDTLLPELGDSFKDDLWDNFRDNNQGCSLDRRVNLLWNSFGGSLWVSLWDSLGGGFIERSRDEAQ